MRRQSQASRANPENAGQGSVTPDAGRSRKDSRQRAFERQLLVWRTAKLRSPSQHESNRVAGGPAMIETAALLINELWSNRDVA